MMENFHTWQVHWQGEVIQLLENIQRNFCPLAQKRNFSSVWKMQDACFSAFNGTWRSCDSPRRPSTAAWQIDDSGAWIPRCSQTVLSVNNQLQREDLKTKRKGVWKWSSMLRASCSGSTNLPGSDLNVKVVPLVWNLEDFRPSKSVYPESVFVHQ